ncbi:MAG: HAD family phosphatase [Salinivirgaceae bacterium]|jgi:putative hydrolase of the HAD superfamily
MQIDLSQFEAIIFDFGGVILDIDPERTWNSFARFANREKIQQVIDNGVLQKFEMGAISATEIRSLMNQQFDTQIPDEAFNRAWNAMLVDYKPKRIQRIQWLKQSHRLFLLSNTNSLHFEFFSAKLQKEYGVGFNDLFIKTYTSYEMGLLKPDREIYHRVLIEQNLNPETTLFIEDSRENAEAAELLGIQTLVIPRNGSFYDYFL